MSFKIGDVVNIAPNLRKAAMDAVGISSQELNLVPRMLPYGGRRATVIRIVSPIKVKLDVDYGDCSWHEAFLKLGVPAFKL